MKYLSNNSFKYLIIANKRKRLWKFALISAYKLIIFVRSIISTKSYATKNKT